MQKPCTVGRNQLKIGRILRASKKFVKMLWFFTCWMFDLTRKMAKKYLVGKMREKTRIQYFGRK